MEFLFGAGLLASSYFFLQKDLWIRAVGLSGIVVTTIGLVKTILI